MENGQHAEGMDTKKIKKCDVRPTGQVLKFGSVYSFPNNAFAFMLLPHTSVKWSG